MNASDLLNDLTKTKTRQADLISYVKEQNDLLGIKLYDCGSWLRIREWQNSEVSKCINANFCKQFLLCPFCARRRAMKFCFRAFDKVQQTMLHNPQLIPVLITFTIRNGEDLPERFQHLKHAWKKMCAMSRKGKSLTCRHARIQWSKVEGSFKAIEVTKRDKGWHPHIHCFALINDWIDVEELSAEWRWATGDSYIVDVRKIDTEKENGLLYGIFEVLKYCLKVADLAPDLAYQCFLDLKGSRLTDSQGILRGIPEPDIDQDDLDGETGPYRDLIALWSHLEGKFNLHDSQTLAHYSWSTENRGEAKKRLSPPLLPNPDWIPY